MAKKAMIAMSGGVDSSVAAYLMKMKGYDCIGVTMKLYEEEPGPCRDKTCCSLDDVEDARSVAIKLGIPYYVFNFKEDFRDKVIDPFIDSYLRGFTPNPCIECNRHLKFAHLYQRARALKCDVIVTGHYARVIEKEGRYELHKGLDEKKDQSYVLYAMTQDQLAHTRFPLGEYRKEQIRAIAQEQGFFNAKKHDSQDICFIPDGDYKAFIEKVTGRQAGPGDFLDQEGRVVGRHKGYYGYTIGQRRGLGISAPSPYYVTEIIPEENKVILGSNHDLFHRSLIAQDFNWVMEPVPGETVRGRIRYHQEDKEAVYQLLDDGRVKIVFQEAQRAITPGQAVVLYKGDALLGGGTIMSLAED